MEKTNNNNVEVRETGIVTDTNIETENVDDKIYVIDGLVVPKWLYDREIEHRRVG